MPLYIEKSIFITRASILDNRSFSIFMPMLLWSISTFFQITIELTRFIFLVLQFWIWIAQLITPTSTSSFWVRTQPIRLAHIMFFHFYYFVQFCRFYQAIIKYVLMFSIHTNPLFLFYYHHILALIYRAPMFFIIFLNFIDHLFHTSRMFLLFTLSSFCSRSSYSILLFTLDSSTLNAPFLSSCVFL